MRKIKCDGDVAVAVLAQYDHHFVTLLGLENDTLPKFKKDIGVLFEERAIHLGYSWTCLARNGASVGRRNRPYGGKAELTQNF